MIKKILVPTDFSITANKARDYAIKIALEFGAELELLNSYHIPYSNETTASMVNIDERLRIENKKLMDDQANYLQMHHPNLKVKYHCIPGLAVDSIRDFTEDDGVDLIVMGTTGATGFIGNLFGSNTSSLIGSVAVPVITVPDTGVINLPEHIIVATDLLTPGEEETFDFVKQLKMKNNSCIDFLMVVDDRDEIKERYLRFRSASFDEEFDAQYHPFHFKENDNVEDGILDYIEKKSADLLVVVSNHRSFWEKLFDKSISKSLVKQSSIPVLVLPN